MSARRDAKKVQNCTREREVERGRERSREVERGRERSIEVERGRERSREVERDEAKGCLPRARNALLASDGNAALHLSIMARRLSMDEVSHASSTFVQLASEICSGAQAVVKDQQMKGNKQQQKNAARRANEKQQKAKKKKSQRQRNRCGW